MPWPTRKVTTKADLRVGDTIAWGGSSTSTLTAADFEPRGLLSIIVDEPTFAGPGEGWAPGGNYWHVVELLADATKGGG